MATVIERLQTENIEVADADLAHYSPTRFELINAYDRYHFNIAEEWGRKQLRELRNEELHALNS